MPDTLSLFAALRRIGLSADPRFDRRVVVVVAVSVIAGLAELLSIGAVAPLVTAAIDGDARVAGLPDWGVTTWAVVFGVLVAVAAVLRMALSMMAQRQVLEMSHRIGVAVHARVLAQPYRWHVERHSSALVAALNSVDTLLYGVGWPVMQAASSLLVGGAILLLLSSVSVVATAASVVVLGLLYFALSRLFTRALARHGAVLTRHYERQVRILQDSSGAIRDLLVDGRQDAFVEAFAASSRAIVDARRGTDVLANAPRFLIEAVGAIALAGIVVLVSDRAGGLTAILPVLALFALAFVRLLPLAHQLYRGWTSMRGAASVIGDVDAFLRLPMPRAMDPIPVPFEHAIALEDATFAYGDGASVLQGVNLRIPKGEWIGLTGPSGGGKSTLGDLLIGLIEPSSGKVTIDAATLDAARLAAWQAHVAPVSQSVFLADASIAENIAFASQGAIDRPRLDEVLRLAALDEWVDTHSGRLDEPVGERGIRVSGGQRQRIGIARALYKNADVLVLDEATNALDRATETRILAAIREARPGLTVLLISHRDAALAACDRVYQVEDGRVTAL